MRGVQEGHLPLGTKIYRHQILSSVYFVIFQVGNRDDRCHKLSLSPGADIVLTMLLNVMHVPI